MDNKRTISQLSDEQLTQLMNWRAKGMGIIQIAGLTTIDRFELARFFKQADAEDAA